MVLQPFVPKLALRLLRGSAALPQAPYVETFNGVALMADVSGFSTLVDGLAARHGDRGAEHLQEILNRYFGPLTDLVERAGGEVVCFPGDAALALWTAEAADPERLALLVQRASACGLELQSVLGKLPAVDGIELRLRIAIGAGRAWAALVGGADARWETVLQGEPVEQLRETLDLANRGELLLSPRAREMATSFGLIGAAVSGEPRGACFVVRGAKALAGVTPVGALAAPDDIIRSLAPASVVERVEAGQHAWLAEFRQLSVVFVYVKAGGAEHPEHLDRLHGTVRIVQDAVLKFSGVVNQIVFDEKGLTLVLAFGIAQRAHEDDAARAVRTALAIREHLGAIGIDARVGLASGRVFTGGRGGESRLEFAVLGSTVVLAARLAWVADDILCDGATRAASRKGVRYGVVPPLVLKGKTERVEAWRPLAIKDGHGDGDGRGPIGRDKERAALEAHLVALELAGQGSVVLLEGEPGIGKTALVGELLRKAQSRAVRSLVGGGDAIEQRTTYRPWRSIVSSLLGIELASDAAAMNARLIQLLGSDNEVWIPLLNPVLPRALPETDQIRALNPESRARTTRDLLVRLLDTAARVTPLVVVLEDAHWMDSASWELAENAAAGVPRLLLVLSTRTTVGHDAAIRLAARPGASRIQLGLMSDADIRDLVSRRLDVDEIPDELAALICPRAEGHPLFAEEMAVALRDAGVLTVREGTCRLTADARGSALSLPTTIQGVVATRIDQLTPQEQMTLKVAAVLGRHFLLSDLAAVHPLGDGASLITRQAQRIGLAGLLVVDMDVNACSFSHAIVQEVAYELLPYTQRSELHRRTAEWLERREDDGELSPVLAHHWERAEVAEKAMHYLEQAGETALFRQSANPEAAEFFTRLIALADKQPAVRTVALAGWERMLAQALARLGRHGQAVTHLERGITLLGDTPPSFTLGCRIEFLRGLVARLVRQPAEVREQDRAPEERIAALELARAYDAYVRLLYLGRSGTLISSVATMRSVTAAERAGPSAELSQTYSLFANFEAMFRRERLSNYYSSQARKIAEQVGDRHALFRALTMGQLPAFVRGQWAQATPALNEGLALGAELRIVRDSLVYSCARASISLNQGQLADASSRFEDIAQRAGITGDLVPRLWATVGMGEVAFRRGNMREAIVRAEHCLELIDTTETVEQNTRFQAHGLLASAWLREAGVDRAARHVDLAMAAGDAGARLGFAPQAGFVGVAEVLFALHARGGGEGAAAAKKLRRWLRLLRLTAFARPILDPWDLYFRAAWHRARGRRRMAARQLRRAIRQADRMHLAYEAGAARVALARLLGNGDPERQRALGEARRLLEEIGAEALLREAGALAGDASRS